MIQGVIFDMDGLMFDTEQLEMRSWDIVGEQMGYGALGRMGLRTLGCTGDDTERIFYEELGADFPYTAFRAKAKVWRHAEVAAHGLPVKPGLRALVELLRARGIPYAIGTSSRRDTALQNLRDSGLVALFPVIVGGDMVKNGKPAPDIFLEAARRLSLEPAQCMVFEDSPNGIRAARAAGMTAVMVPDLLQPDAQVRALCHHVLDSLCDVPTLFGLHT